MFWLGEAAWAGRPPPAASTDPTRAAAAPTARRRLIRTMAWSPFVRSRTPRVLMVEAPGSPDIRLREPNPWDLW